MMGKSERDELRTTVYRLHLLEVVPELGTMSGSNAPSVPEQPDKTGKFRAGADRAITYTPAPAEAQSAQQDTEKRSRNSRITRRAKQLATFFLNRIQV